jgi:glutamate/tyrosine decarboxylase-like PLP-dependent enzyme
VDTVSSDPAEALDRLFPPLAEALRAYRRELDDGPVMPDVKPDEIRKALHDRYSFESPVRPETVIADVARMLSEWQVHTTHPCYYGLFNPDSLPIGVVADTMVAGFNPQIGAWSHNPAANEIENHTLGYIQRLMGHDPVPGTAAFTSGGMEANHQAVIVALTDRFESYAEEGAASLGAQPVLYVSEEAHHSFLKIAHACGIGRRAVREVPVDGDLRMSLSDLATAVDEDRANGLAPFMVVATAGTTTAGAIDPMPEIAAVGREHGLWFHVDAAWGGGALFSRNLRPLLAGIEHADSVTFDAHKWLSVPMGAGMFFCKSLEALDRAFGIRTAYMPDKSAVPDRYATSLQWSRRFIGLKLFMAMAELGAEGYERKIDHMALMGDELRRLLGEAGWRVLNTTRLPLICFTHEALDSGRVDRAELLQRIYSRRKVWISRTRLAGGIQALRACITNYRSQIRDLESLVAELQAALGTTR